MNLTSAVALARAGKEADWLHAETAILEVRMISEAFSSLTISMPNGPRSAALLAYSGWRHAACNYFHPSTATILPFSECRCCRSSRPCANEDCCSHDPNSAHRIDRHGQVDGCGDVPARGRARVRRRRGRARAQGPGGDLVDKIGELFPGLSVAERWTGNAWRRSCFLIREALHFSRRSFIQPCARRVKALLQITLRRRS